MVETLFLPKSTAPSRCTIDLSGSEPLPRFALTLDFRTTDQPNEQMHMIGHYDKIAKMISLSVEVHQAVRDKLCQGWLSKQASSVTAIQVFHELAGKRLMKHPLQFGPAAKRRLPIGTVGIDALSPEPGTSPRLPALRQFLRRSLQSETSRNTSRQADTNAVDCLHERRIPLSDRKVRTS
jgi:hypothetical protein